MKLLLDTHLLLWAAEKSARLSPVAIKALSNTENELLFSATSIWEVAIKAALGRKDFQVNPRQLRNELLDNGYAELPLMSRHAVAIDALPSIHKDPFDRLLIAQAIVEGITLLTVDSIVAKYPGPIRKV
jgi:PIN domain nuclease of toxin-antitoxin system